MPKVNVITGGGSGIGFASAQFLPKDQIVLITGRNEKKLSDAAALLQSKGYQVETISCDISKSEDANLLASHAASLGTIQSVIHAAGVSAGQADLEQIIRINALGVVYIVRAFAKVIKPGGCIAVIGSCSSHSLPRIMMPIHSYPLALKDEETFIKRCVRRAKIIPNVYKQKSIAYCMTKNFVRWYLLNCAYHYAKQNIRIVCLSPGVVDTALGQTELKNPETQSILRYTGLNRPARPEEIGFLAASVIDERNGYLLGTDILCDGGCTSAGFDMAAALSKSSKPKDWHLL
ncbi:MAG: SDR family oxidoreductase [Lachnospiraceae bacterium]|nr:SDR family oxidoreductase [Lachnospiraceae bacterium]